MALAREGLTPRQADQVRDMATRSTPVMTGDLRPSIQLDHIGHGLVRHVEVEPGPGSAQGRAMAEAEYREAEASRQRIPRPR